MNLMNTQIAFRWLMNNKRASWFLSFLTTIMLTACMTNEALPTPISSAVPFQPTPTAAFEVETADPNQTPQSPTAIPAGIPTTGPISINLPSNIPIMVADSIWQLAAQGDGRFTLTDDPAQAQIQVAVNEGTVLSRWVYVVAAPFAA
jgi:hypothetical protein